MKRMIPIKRILKLPQTIFLICFILPAIIIISNLAWSLNIHPLDQKKLQLITDDTVWFTVNVIPHNNTIEFRGFASIRGISNNRYNWQTPSYNTQFAVYSNNTLILKDSQGKMFSIRTYSVSDPSVSVLLGDVRDHDNDGFAARILKNELKKGETYSVGMLLTRMNGEQTIAFSKEMIKL